ncbi:MAG: hypothetical protein ACRENU_04615 [Gemmatimonadaceae bacterium]
MQRRAMNAVALTLGLTVAPALAAQSGTRTGPAPDTPKLLVAVFASADNASGVQVANSVRTRITNAVPIRQLYVIPWERIDSYLKSSGYKADSALGPGDLKELAKLLSADEVLLGSVSKTGTGLRIDARLALARDPSQSQPLGSFDVTNPADAARPIERALMEARKQLADTKACERAITDQKPAVAIPAARAAIVKFPNAILARLCLATAFQAAKQADSSLKVIEEIRRLDPKLSFVHRLAYIAYTEKGDTENAVRALVQLLALEPWNQSLQQQVIQLLGSLGKPAIAIPIVDTLLLQNPGDPQMLKQRWQLILLAAAAEQDSTARVRLLTQAMQAGENMVRADTSTADSTYFTRQTAAATAAANAQKAVEYSSLATAKFPSNQEYWYLRAQNERKAGQLQMALQSINRLYTLNSKYPNLNLFVAQIYVDMNQPDSAIGVARRAVAAGEDAKQWGQFLLQPVNALFKEAQRDKDIPKFRRVLALSQESDRLASTPHSNFFIGVAAYFIANDLIVEQAQPLLTRGQKTENARTKNQLYGQACPLLKEGADMNSLIMIHMPRGGSVEPSLAQQILGWVGQVGDYVSQATKVACK